MKQHLIHIESTSSRRTTHESIVSLMLCDDSSCYSNCLQHKGIQNHNDIRFAN